MWPALLALIMVLSASPSFLTYFHLEAEVLHKICLKRLNFDSPLADIHQALVCGKRLPASPLKDLILKGGLIHLTVVSGAHLLFLEKLWKKIPLPSPIKTHGIFLILILYAFASNLHPPVVRALFSFFLFRLSHHLKLFWNGGLIALLSGALCLLYRPEWVYSFSLQLSLLAVLLYNISASPLSKCFFIYIFILPIVNRWQALHPASIFINWTFAPLMSGLLFPFSFLSPFCPFLYPVADFLWQSALKVLKMAQFLPSRSPLMQYYIAQEQIWPYIGLVFFIVFIINFKSKLQLYPKQKKDILSKNKEDI